jgi:hypothetical protein
LQTALDNKVSQGYTTISSGDALTQIKDTGKSGAFLVYPVCSNIPSGVNYLYCFYNALDSNSGVLYAADNTTNKHYANRNNAGTWSGWREVIFVDSPTFVNKTGDTMTGDLNVTTPGVVANYRSWCIELNNSTTAGPAYVDFHSSGNANDYDTRIISWGGNTSAGGGQLDFIGASITSNNKPIWHSGNFDPSSKVDRIDLTATVQQTSYRKSVIALCDLTNTDTSANSYTSGKLLFHRANGLNGVHILTVFVGIEKMYNTTQPQGHISTRW